MFWSFSLSSILCLLHGRCTRRAWVVKRFVETQIRRFYIQILGWKLGSSLLTINQLPAAYFLLQLIAQKPSCSLTNHSVAGLRLIKGKWNYIFRCLILCIHVNCMYFICDRLKIICGFCGEDGVEHVYGPSLNMDEKKRCDLPIKDSKQRFTITNFQDFWASRGMRMFSEVSFAFGESFLRSMTPFVRWRWCHYY